MIRAQELGCCRQSFQPWNHLGISPAWFGLKCSGRWERGESFTHLPPTYSKKRRTTCNSSCMSFLQRMQRESLLTRRFLAKGPAHQGCPFLLVCTNCRGIEGADFRAFAAQAFGALLHQDLTARPRPSATQVARRLEPPSLANRVSQSPLGMKGRREAEWK